MKKALSRVLLSLCAAICLAGCGAAQDTSSEEVVVYNWGEYCDPDVLTMFEEETGIHVIYDEYETNEIMYPKVASGAGEYDVLCPSDYMIEELASKDLLQEINMDHIPNAKNIGEEYDAHIRAGHFFSGREPVTDFFI